MNEIKAQVRDILIGDAELLGLLAENNNPYNKSAPPSKQESVIDHLNADQQIPPFVTVRLDAETLIGQTHLTNAFILVRCYNERDKTFYTINEVLSKVRKLLNGKRLTLEGYANVETVWETTSAELLDEAVDMNYRELQFNVKLI